MTITQNYKNAFAEVYEIISFLDDEDYNKIPQDVISVIEQNRNLDYEYEMNDEVDIFSQPMLPETKAILFNFFRDYWATDIQKDKIFKMQREELEKLEREKQLKYGVDNIFKKNNEQPDDTNSTLENDNSNQSTAIIEVKKQNIFIRILNKIKAFFK